MNDTFDFTLESPLTKEQINLITDAEFEHTDRIWFVTPKGKHVEFVKAPQWIPCSERLPKPSDHMDDMVLVSTKDGKVRFGSCWYNRAMCEGWVGDMPVVAWMPLPEPYIRGEEE